MVLPVAFIGFAFVSSYTSDCSANLQKEYNKKGKSVYFTDKVVVDFTQGVIPYNMIVFAHLTNVKSKYNTLTSISLHTYDNQQKCNNITETYKKGDITVEDTVL